MLDAGSVTTTLTFKTDSAGAKAYEDRLKTVTANAEAAEGRLAAAAGRLASAHDRAAESAQRVAQAGRRITEDAPLKAMDGWSKSSGQASQNLQKLGAVGAKTAAAGIVAIGAATIYAAAKATSFNREMLRLQTQAGASRDEVAKFSTAILSLAGTVPQGPKELSEGLYHIVSAGFRGAQALDILKASAEGAALGGADLQDTANALIGTLASQIKGVHGAADAQGQLNAIVGAGNMRFEDLDKAVATGVLPTFASAGLSLEDFGAALATVTDNSTPANVTATRLRMTIAQMVSPTKAAATELKSIGLTSTSLADDLRKPNGLLVAVEDLKTHLKDSGKTAVEQDQILSNSFGRGKSSATIITLVDEIGRLTNKYQELGKTDGVKRLQQDWSEFQKSEAASFEELKSGAESFAITVGHVLLPELSSLAKEGGKDLSSFISSGGAKEAGHDIQNAFSTIGTSISDLAPDVEVAAGALIHAAAAASSVGDAFGLGLSGQIATAAAAFLAFKSVAFVVPIIEAVGGAISTVGVAAATAPSVAAFVSDLSEAGLAIPLLGGALALAAGAFVALQSGLFSSESAAEKNAAAMEHDRHAIESLHNATAKTSEAHLAAERAALNHKKALEQLDKVERQIANKQLKGPEASNARLEAKLAVGETANQVDSSNIAKAKAISELATISQKSIDIAREGRKLADEEVLTAEKLIKLHPPATAKEEADQQRNLNELKAEANKATERSNQLVAEAAVRQESVNRLNAGQPQITSANAPGVADLQKALSQAGAPQKIVTRYELDDQDAQAQLGRLASQLDAVGKKQIVANVLTNAPSAAVALAALKAVVAGVPSSKVIRILHNAPSAKAAMGALGSAVKGLPSSKSILVQTNAAVARGEVESVEAAIDNLSGKSIAVQVQTAFTKVESVVKRIAGHASGRGTGNAEVSLVGEGRGQEYVIDSTTGTGYKTQGPSLAALSPSDYVVPLEDRYRGRALGLFSMLARDLNIPGYKTGKAPKHRKPMPVPNAIPPLSLPLSDIESKESAAKSKYEKAASKVSSLEGKIRTTERDLQYASKKGTAKAKDAAKLKELQAELRKAKGSKNYTVEHHRMQEWQRTLKEAKAFQVKINDRTLEANNAGNAMRLAAEHGDEAAYAAAKSKRTGALGNLEGLIREAQKQVKTGSEYALQLEGQLQTAQLEAGQTEGESLSEAALTPGQVAEEKRLEAQVALAALTPGLSDDTTAAQQLVSFFESALSSAQSRGAGSEAIIELATDVKNARANVESLTTGTATNENPDVQAQITQANERAEVAERSARIAEGALAVFSGAGDIGQGGANAAVAVTQNFNMLHPGDPRTQEAIASAAVGGMGYQRPRSSPRIQVGP